MTFDLFAIMWKERLSNVFWIARTVFKWGWVPFILYLGECRHRTMPDSLYTCTCVLCRNQERWK